MSTLAAAARDRLSRRRRGASTCDSREQSVRRAVRRVRGARHATRNRRSTTGSTPATLRNQLLGVDGALVWVNPIDAGRLARARSTRCCARSRRAGVFVSAHPDVIMKLGTKDVSSTPATWAGAATSIDSTRCEQLRTDLGRAPGRRRGPGPEAVARAQRHWRVASRGMAERRRDHAKRATCSRGMRSEAAPRSRCASTTSSR